MSCKGIGGPPRLEDFINPTGTSSYELPNETGGTITVNHGRWAALSDIVASPSTFCQTNFAPVGGGFDLRSYDFIDLRAGRLGGNERHLGSNGVTAAPDHDEQIRGIIVMLDFLR